MINGQFVSMRPAAGAPLPRPVRVLRRLRVLRGTTSGPIRMAASTGTLKGRIAPGVLANTPLLGRTADFGTPETLEFAALSLPLWLTRRSKRGRAGPGPTRHRSERHRDVQCLGVLVVGK